MDDSAHLNRVSKAILEQKAVATFACGGSIPIASNMGKAMSTDNISAPVTIRWDFGSISSPVQAKITFGIGDESLSHPSHAVNKSLDDAKPATFVRGREDVLDKTYRKASSLAEEQFCTDFCPYKLGIVDIIAQLLLPSVQGGSTNRNGI